MPTLLLLLLVVPSATFRFSFAATDPATAAAAGDGRVEIYNSISKGGFFSQTWDVHHSKSKMRVRQVPGDGSCLFHAIYVALAHATNGSHPQEDYDDMCKAAGVLRQTALDYLSQDPNRLLTVTYNQDMKSQELLEMTSKEMGLSAEQYLARLRDPKEWGGGLEIVALANALERPIFLYELKPVGLLFWSRFVFKKMVECGMPKFSPNKSLHILIADCNFPDCAPYFYNKAGNHFLALFPCEDVPIVAVIEKKKSAAAAAAAAATAAGSAAPTPGLASSSSSMAEGGREGRASFGRRVFLRGRMLRRLEAKIKETLFFRGSGGGGGAGGRRKGGRLGGKGKTKRR
ncbi:cysteine protease domain containing protein [Nannochloropsis oceanica]